MSWNVKATGSAHQSFVDEGAVQDVLQAEGDLNHYRSWATFFLGALLSTAPMLAAEVTHPIPIYMVLVAEGALAVAMLMLSKRQKTRLDKAKEAMAASKSRFDFTITPAGSVAWGITTEAPSTEAAPSTDLVDKESSVIDLTKNEEALADPKTDESS